MNFFNDAFNYESRKVALDYVDGLEVSTAYTSDEGYETAIIDTERVYPVERYPDKGAAERGHARWVDAAKTLTEVTRLPWLDDFVPAEKFTLKRG